MLLVRAPTARISGFMRYSFLDENDQLTFAHDQYGREIRGGFWSPNLVTNAGLNAVATARLRSYPTALEDDPQNWRGWMVVGTGSTAPAFTDTVLAAEVFDENPGDLATNNNGGFSDVNTFPDPSGGFITASWRITRVFTLASTLNLTEYGFSTTPGGSLTIRELFRDEGGNPVTISIAAGKKIRVDHTLLYSLPWGAGSESFNIEEYNVSNALVATHSVTADCLWVAVQAGNRSKMFYAALPYRGSALSTKRFGVYESAPSTDPTTAAANSGDLATSSAAYVNGSYQIREQCTVPEAGPNGVLHGFVFRILGTTGVGDSPQQGFRVAFNNPATFTKADTHTLTLAMILSWSRA